MTNLRIHPEVADDLDRAKSWYLDIDPDLTESFLNEVYRAMELAQVAPEQYSRIYKHYRRVLCQRFPYKIVFEIEEAAQAIHVLAVNHTSQHPNRWKNRILKSQDESAVKLLTQHELLTAATKPKTRGKRGREFGRICYASIST